MPWRNGAREVAVLISGPRPISPEGLKGKALSARPEGVTFDAAGRRHRLYDGFANMGEPYRTAGEEHRVDVFSGQSRLREADLDSGRDAPGQLPCMADKIGAADGGAEAWRDPFQRDFSLALVGQSDLGFLDLHCQRVAALFVDHTHQPIEQDRLTGLVPNLTDIGDHLRLIHTIDVRPGGEVVEIMRGHVEPGALHGASEAEQRHDDAETELTIEIR